MKLYENRGINGAMHAPVVLLAFCVIAGWAAPARAYLFNTSPDWDVELDTNLAYTLGLRANNMNHKYGNNPDIQESEYKFPNLGSVISDRLDLASEFSAVYDNSFGIDVSYSGWKDFAYGDKIENNPGTFAGLPYYDFAAHPSGHYGAYSNHLYNFGGELGNAFALANITPAGIPVSIKIGRFTEYWGNALFSGFQAISYAQSPVDEIKAVDAPGTEIKDLFLPRTQISVHAQLLPSLSVGGYYQAEWRAERFPEGGTSLGIEDPLFSGATKFPAGILTFPRGSDITPPAIDGNFGVEALWSPGSLNGTLGLYFRQYDDDQPYAAAALGYVPNLNYHLAYARHARLYGVSLDRNIGAASFDIESSIRTNTGLETAALANPPTDLNGADGARGDLLNVVANSIYSLTPSPLWQTGSLVGEVAWTHVLAVTHDKNLYDGVGYAACAAPGEGWKTGCATTNEVNFNILFDPQWLQVFSGVDIDAPVSIGWGAIGNGQTVATSGDGSVQDSAVYSFGIHALYRQKYNISLSYHGFQAPVGKAALAYPGGPLIYTGGSGQWMWNDRQQIFLVLSTQF